MPRVHKTATAFVILFGIVHIAMAPVFFDEFAMRVMWYVAQGLMGVVVGLLNIAAVRVGWRDRVTTRLCHLANCLCLVFGVLYSTVDRALPSYVGTLLFAVLSVSALAVDRGSEQGR